MLRSAHFIIQEPDPLDSIQDPPPLHFILQEKELQRGPETYMLFVEENKVLCYVVCQA